jgi:enterochelin esterase-like enzyme
MKKLSIITGVLILIQVGLQGVNGQNAPRANQAAPRGNFQNRPVIVSPDILKDNRVVFRLYAPKADTVKLVCDWMQGAESRVNMAKNDSGLWSVTIGPLPQEVYGYTFNLDGVTVLDPLNPLIKRDVRNNTSILLISGNETDYYTPKEVPHGTLSKVWYNSPTLQLTRRMYVYTPAGYEDNKKTKYPVLYLLHGSGGDEDAWTQLGRAPTIMDNLIAQGKSKPMIVVMTNGNPTQEAEMGNAPLSASQSGRPPVAPAAAPGANSGRSGNQISGRFEESLVKDVIPFIESHYRVLKDKNNRAIAGLSMGGGHTQTITLNYPDMFAYIGVFSMGIRNMNDDLENQFKVLKSKNPKLYYVAVGKADNLTFTSTQNLVAVLKKDGFNYVYNETSGWHSWSNWRIYLSDFAPRLFK